MMMSDKPLKTLLFKSQDEFFFSFGYYRYKDNYRGKGYYFTIGGYDLTKRDADAIWNAFQEVGNKYVEAYEQAKDGRYVKAYKEATS